MLDGTTQGHVNTHATGRARLNIAVIGIGRMGKRHACNVAYHTHSANLVAICDAFPGTMDWSKTYLPGDVQHFLDFETMVRTVQLDAVVIATDTASHAPLASKALRAGLHVLLEKPVSIDLEMSLAVAQDAAQHPAQKLMIGFSRRYDDSYQAAKAAIDEGQLGRAYLIKSATNDQFDPSGFFVAYSKASGGIFMDCGIHDIDIARWMFNVESSGKKQVQRVFATGMNIRHPELADDGDVDNALGTVEFSNGTICTFHLSRTAMHGHDCFTEIFGSQSKIIVNGNPSMNRIEIRDQHGVRTTSTPTYYERFKDAFVSEVNTFVDCCLNDKPVPSTLEDGIEAAKIAIALTRSYRLGQPVLFDDNGEPMFPLDSK